MAVRQAFERHEERFILLMRRFVVAGRKGRSGPPGNLNASKHGLTTWLRRRALPKQKQHIVKLVQDYAGGLLSCKGGAKGATEVEAAVIENAARAYGASLLVLEEAAVRGLVREANGTWDLTPGFMRLVGFLNAERMSLLGLGLSRRAKNVSDLNTLLAEAANDKEGDGR